MDKISRIFDSFTQADKSIATEYGGTGLGLVIFKRLVELQEGNISVTSQTGVSSEFRFYLSFEKHVYVDSVPVPDRTHGNMKNLQGMKVLISEDNRINAKVLSGF